jgi:hypothetical protein
LALGFDDLTGRLDVSISCPVKVDKPSNIAADAMSAFLSPWLR